jgi:poly(3-hydroxybutyrate) depolymerase
MMNQFFENSQLYNLKEIQQVGMAPIRMMANVTKHLFSNPLHPMSYTGLGRHMAAAGELIERITQSYPKPEFGLQSTIIDGKKTDIWEEIILEKPFCKLKRFKRDNKQKASKLLVVAPMSGHHATLLRGTVEALLPHHDVYITDWVDGREVPLFKGEFNLTSYIDYLIEFMQKIGPGVHAMAVCQPAVPLFAATALMNEDNDACAPRSITLMGGPIDTRKAPTKVNSFAKEHPMSWFESNVITRVPLNYPGFMRRVYPGFLQLTGFMTMNLDRHVGEHIKLFNHLVQGDGDSANSHRTFYNEYLAVADLPAEFYLQTIEEVFHKHSLPDGKLQHHGRKVKPAAINKTAILAIEGELDDISGVGQTRAALDIALGLKPGMKKYHLQKDVGHYGIFNGRKWRELVRPVISEWIAKNS